MIPFWYAVPAIVAILAGESIFFCGNLRRFHKFMGFTFIFEGLMMMLWGIMTSKLGLFYLPIYALYAAMVLFSPLFYYFAIRSVVKEEGIDAKDCILLAIPTAFILSLIMIAQKVPAADKTFFYAIAYGKLPIPNHLNTGTAVMFAVDDTLYIIGILGQIIVMTYSFVSLKRYGKLLETYFSDTSDKSLGLLNAIFGLMALRLIVLLFVDFVPSVSTTPWFRVVQTITFSLFYIVLAVFIFKIRFTAEELGKSIASQESKSQAPVAGELISAKMSEIIGSRFYTDPATNLIDLAAKIQINTKYLSDYIRFHYGTTFLSFVNNLRIEYAISLMEEGKHQLYEISEMAGFISPSTFYRNFTKIKGISPSEYKKK